MQSARKKEDLHTLCTVIEIILINTNYKIQQNIEIQNNLQKIQKKLTDIHYIV